MKIMADLVAVNLGMDENEADIAEELQDFDESFNTRSEASENGSGSSDSDSEPSISSESTAPSTANIEDRKHKSKSKATVENKKERKQAAPAASKRLNEPPQPQNGKITKINKKKRPSEKFSPSSSSNNKSSPAVAAAEMTTTTTTSKLIFSTSSDAKKKGSKIAKKSRKKTRRNSGFGITSVNGSSSTGGGGVDVKSTDEIKKEEKEDDISKNIKANNDESEAEFNAVAAPPPPSFESDSESVDSDSAANIKRNGRTNAPKSSSSPEKKSSGGGGISSSSNSAGSKSKSYDYMTKLNYLFRDTRFFLIKSNNADNIGLSKSKNVWATLPQNDSNLNQAFKEARNVLLIFSVNESGKFAGFARMSAPSSRDIPQPAWVLPPSISPKALGGVIELDWICRKELSFNCTSHLYNFWNEGKPVKIGRDGQEIEPKVGAELCRLFPEDEKIELTPILRKSKETAKMMREKGIRVVYKPPRSLSSSHGGNRGGLVHGGGYRNGGGGSGGGGPMRHKRSYGSSGPHRPYKIPSMGPPIGGGFNRSSSPQYRSNGGGPGSSGNLRGGDSLLPPWERYINSATAEAYVADYMRTMHNQLPPLPFVPFGQLPLSTVGTVGNGVPPPGLPPYEQLPPPVRYYDGPPLPDYPPPPQGIRPPPPGFDKAPSYEDFAAWKNAGLPTVPPPGFQSSLSSNNISSSNSSNVGGSASGSGSGSGTHSLYRNSSSRGGEANSNVNRIRDHRTSGGPSARESSYRSGGERERHFRGGGHRTSYRDSRR